MRSALMEVLDSDAQRVVANVRAAAQRIWQRPLHRDYTDHSIAHSERVITLLDGLSEVMMATNKRLGPTEVLVLLAAAYLHDIGMQDERFAGGDLEAIRAAHHERSAEWIYRAAEDPAQAVQLGLPDDPGLVEVVALVSKGHRRVDLLAAAYDPFTHGSEMVRPRLLAALLRFGDELDIDHRRVDLELLKLMAPPLESQLHWWKCYYVSGMRIEDEYIQVQYRLPPERPDYAKLIVPLVESEIRRKHAEMEEIFRAHAVKVALGRPQVRSMRLVQALSPELEALARQWLEERGAPETQRPQAPEGSPPAARSERPPSRQRTVAARTTVFDQRGQTVHGDQVNIAGDYIDQGRRDSESEGARAARTRAAAGPGAKPAKGEGEAPAAQPLLGKGKAWAVLVGVNWYDDQANYGQLSVCVKDVQTIQQQLLAGGFDPPRTRLLTDLSEELPTRANILTALKAVANATEREDLLLFYYSGHGDQDEGESYLVGRDGRALVLGDTAVPLSRVKEILQEAPARAKVIILDACHSGADIGGKGPQPMSAAFIRRVFEQAEGLAILASCKQKQVSYEWKARERSVFTYYMLEALAGEADRDEKGFVTVQDASRHVTNGVKLWASNRNLTQTPTLQYTVAGDIILCRYGGIQ